ncbi:N-acetylmuramoyl-L-alanine amidase CwlD [Paenibacillus physcomitrellae]|uniref:Germination-specific N-acetylmuramoyl-L-alanine amidase n=1 Tax=Paenibacillus physcomitrellae TaxID=1619311 RepID=A0ABQ1GXP0_9BACL|nr:N-acetylmuramoyl-L-alanine amidase CwlD [Paenibacillus physcomitrellae]GGA51842.1 germination-specific N-acetylmuramoyl-L-alanine amidase [Paenibacillus physcomitrellae]
MKPRKTVTLWISLSNVKRIVFSAVLLALLAGILFYEVPAQKVSNYWSLPLAGKVIALDAGHGGPDGGAASKDGIIEKDINLSVALYLRDYLQQAGAVVYMTREEDKDLADPDTSGYSKRKTEDLKKRVRLIEEKEAKLMVSIHMNSIPSNKWRGAQTFYHPSHPESQALADLVQEELRTNLENTDRVAKSADYVYLLKELKIPSVLVEVGFLSNPVESKLLGDDDYQRKVAASIYKGILRYEAGEKAKPST